MPDYAPTFTPRYILKYRNAGYTHNIMVRRTRGEAQAAMIAGARAALGSFFSAMVGKLADDLAFISASYIAEDSTVAFPAAVPVFPSGTLNALSLFSKQDRITAAHFPCTSGNAQKGGLFLFGLLLNPDTVPDSDSSDFIFTQGEDTDFDTAVAVLNGAGLTAIDSYAATWHYAVTVKPHD
jgi:hypothetical protein